LLELKQSMPASTRPSILRKVLQEQFSVLASELATLHEQELSAREAEQRESLRAELTEILNQAVRLLRQAGDFSQMAAVLADSSANFCRAIAVFSVDGDRVRAERARGLSTEGAEQFVSLEFSTGHAAAFAGAIQSGDPMVALATPREVSPEVSRIFAHKPDDRAYILPVVVRGQPAGLIYAAGEVEMASLELLAQTAALALEAQIPAVTPEPSPKPELITIQGMAAPPPEKKVPGAWSDLAPADQELHLRAQRFARVQVAGMRLFSPDLVKQGRDSKDLYSVLQKDIDSGRDMYRKTFVDATPTMVDYFHVELLRTLANEDAGLLGGEYPGPLV
jgi:hypothetical protein